MGTLHEVHATPETSVSYEMTPPHAPRVETETYRKAHHFLVVERDSPCAVCGVRASTLTDPAANPYHATAIETHHYPIERSLVDACDPQKVHQRFPQVFDRASLEAFVDTPANLLVLCDVHHRSKQYGIHHVLTQDFAILPFLYDGYQLTATKATIQQVEQEDETLLAQQQVLSADDSLGQAAQKGKKSTQEQG